MAMIRQDRGIASPQSPRGIQESLVVVGSIAHAPTVRARITGLYARRERLVEKHLNGADALIMRIAWLSGSAGTLKIGALTEAERDILKRKRFGLWGLISFRCGE